MFEYQCEVPDRFSVCFGASEDWERMTGSFLAGCRKVRMSDMAPLSLKACCLCGESGGHQLFVKAIEPCRHIIMDLG